MPDGTSIVFLSEATGTFNIVKQDLATGERTQLTSFTSDGPRRDDGLG